MAGRQVRLDPDVVPIVEAFGKEHDGMSLSRAANEMLRATGEPAVAEAAAVVSSRTIVDSAAPRRAEKCRHPILRRVGGFCLNCGQPVK